MCGKLGHSEKVCGQNGKNPRARAGKVKLVWENDGSDVEMEEQGLGDNVRELYPTPSVFQVECREANKRPRLKPISSTEDNSILMVQSGKQQILRYWARVYIHDRPVTMLVDTGSPISIIPQETAEEVFDPKLDQWEKGVTNIFQDYNGNPVEQVGTLQTDVELNSWRVQKARFLITPKEQNKTPLLGADLIRSVGLKLTQEVEPPNKNQVRKQYLTLHQT